MADSGATEEDATEPPKSEESEEKPAVSRPDLVTTGVGASVILATVFALTTSMQLILSGGNDSIRVVAAAEPSNCLGPVPSSGEWLVHGIVLEDGGPASKDAMASATAILRDSLGNESAEAATLDGAAFSACVQKPASSPGVSSTVEGIEVIARVKAGWFGIERSFSAFLSPKISGGTRWRHASARPALLALGILLFTLAIVSFRPPELGQARLQYVVTAIGAVAFSALFLYVLGLTSQQFGETTDGDEVISLGFGYVHQATFVEGVERDWVLSLTLPNVAPREREAAGGTSASAAAEPARVSQGFGAPIWVLLLAVLAATLYLVIVWARQMVRRVNSEPATTDMLRRHSVELAQHGVYTLLSPVGAIFVYQGLVATDAASGSAAVAIAALSSGVAMSRMMEQAVTKKPAEENEPAAAKA